MARALVQSDTLQISDGAPSALSLAGVVAGNLITCQISVYKASAQPTINAGSDNRSSTWAVADQASVIEGGSGDHDTAGITYAIAGSSGTLNYTPSITNGTVLYAEISLCEWSADDGWEAAPLDVKAHNSNASTNAPTSGATSAKSGQGCLVIGCLVADISSAAGIDNPTGFTNILRQQSNAATVNASHDYKSIDAGDTGTENVSWGTLSASGPWAAAVAVFMDQSTAGGGGGSTLVAGTWAMMGVGL